MLAKAVVQHLRSLREKKCREAAGLFVIEGEKVVAELLAAGAAFAAIYATPRWTGGGSGGNVTAITEAEMARVSHFPSPSPVLAVGRIARRELAAGQCRHGLTLALDGVRDPGNVGTILRIADWYAAARVLLSPDCADLFQQKVINASMGSFLRVATFVAELAPVLAEAGVPVYGCDLAGDAVHGLRFPPDAVVVIGSEGQGLSPAVAARLTRRVTIPRFGAAESLNAGIAAAVICDNFRRLPAPGES